MCILYEMSGTFQIAQILQEQEKWQIEHVAIDHFALHFDLKRIYFLFLVSLVSPLNSCSVGLFLSLYSRYIFFVCYNKKKTSPRDSRNERVKKHHNRCPTNRQSTSISSQNARTLSPRRIKRGTSSTSCRNIHEKHVRNMFILTGSRLLIVLYL